MKLRTKFAVVLLVVTVVLSGSVYGGLELYKDQIVQQNREDVEETAASTARQIDAAVEDRKDFVGFVASRPDAARFDRSDRFLRQFVDNSRFLAAKVVDADGTIVDFHGDVTGDVQQESIGADVGDRPYVERSLDGEVYVSDPEYVDATDRYLVLFSAPIIEDGRVKGALVAAIYLDDGPFFGVLSPISRDDQRVTVTAGSATLFRSGDRLADPIEASSTVESTGWTVTVDRDRSDLLDQLDRLALAQGMGILLIVLSAVAFGVWEYRTTLAQTRKLLDGFTALQAGSFDHQLSLAAAEEWEQISEGFNALAEGLASRENALRQREQRLEVLNRVLRHNLRNDATIVLGYAEVIREYSEHDRVLDAADRLESTGSDLESLSEKARQLEFTMEERDGPAVVDAVELVEDVLANVREEFPGVDVDSSTPASALVRADVSLGLAVANVCENACEHNDGPAPRLDVDLTKDPGADTVTIEVSDNGEGIPDHEWEVLDVGEETPLEHGSGLGLWVAQWAVERSGGTLRFETDAPAGTTVAIEVEAAEPDGEPTAAVPSGATACEEAVETQDGSGSEEGRWNDGVDAAGLADGRGLGVKEPGEGSSVADRDWEWPG